MAQKGNHMTQTDERTPAARADAPENLIERATGLRDRLWENAPAADRSRAVSSEDITAITELGLTSLMTPRAFGGGETSISTLVEVTRALGRGDMSAGWVAGVVNAAAFVVALLPEQAQRDVWAENPHARCAGVLAPTGSSVAVDGGVRVTGRWPYMSGVTHADWAFVSVPIDGSLGPGAQIGFVVVPRSDFEIEDTWFVTGMRGTASNTAVLDDVFVPSHRILKLSDYNPAAYQGIYRTNFFSILSIALVGTIVGEVQSALELVIEKAPKRGIATTNYRAQTDSTSFHVQVGEASQILQSALLAVRQVAAELDGRAADPTALASAADSAKTRADLAFAASRAWKAADKLASAHGTSTFAEVNPLERIWRNAAVASRHAGLAERVGYEFYGRALLGLDPTAIGPMA